MKMIKTRCALCNSEDDYTVLYRENFRESDFNTDIFSARRAPDRVHYRIVKCTNDNLIRSNPILEASHLSTLYKGSRFRYEEEVGNLIATYLDALAPVLRGLPKEAKILEVGCGNGFLLKALYEQGFENVYGLEPSADAVQKADEKIRQNIIADILRPGIFARGTFDLICFFQTFDHIQDPNSFLKLCHALLLPGRFIVSYNHDIESIQSRLLKEKSPIIDIAHTYFYSKETMKRVFEKSRFEVISVSAPSNVVSLRHLMRLLPFASGLKTAALETHNNIMHRVMKLTVRMKLGNIRLVARKPST